MAATDPDRTHAPERDAPPPGVGAGAADPAATEAVDIDVLVVGGGPGGTTAATLLARRGWRVVLLEKDAHPRFHIGESLLPMNLPILERLGVLGEVRAIGTHKLGADFPKPGGDGTNVFRFSRAIDPQYDHAFQVPRAEFDALLFRHARAAGVDAREGVAATRVAFAADGRPARVEARAADGTALAFRPRYLVDASGRDTLLGGALKLKRKDTRHQSAAIFSHFSGVVRRAGEDAGNITVERFAHGWIWLIPLPGDVMSIGAVCWPDYLKQRRGDNEGFLMRTLMEVPSVAARMGGAKRVAPIHVTGNYSYACTRMAGPGWVMVGDAYAFVDPVFSSGVFLAMHSAEHAVEVVDGALREPAREAALQRALSTRLRDGLKRFSWFIYRFNTPVMAHLFANPRNDWQLEEAVISMLAGDVFDNRKVLRRLLAFRAIYALTAIGMAPRALAARWRRRREARAGFEGETLQAGGP